MFFRSADSDQSAYGQTQINRVYHLDRGYETIEKKFSQLGAAIKRIK